MCVCHDLSNGKSRSDEFIWGESQCLGDKENGWLVDPTGKANGESKSGECYLAR